MINLIKRNYIEILLNILASFGLMICSLYWIGIFSSKNILFFFAIPLIIFIVYKPFWGLCLYVFMIPLQSILQITEGFTLLKFFGVFILIGWILQFFISQQKLYTSKPILLSLILVTWGLVSSLWAAYPGASLTRFITFILVVGSFFLVTQIVNSRKKLFYIIFANILGAMISGGFGLYYFILNPNRRITAFPESNQALSVYGISLSLGIFYFLTLSISKTKIIIKFFSFIIFLLLLIAGLSSSTRSFMVSILVSFLFLIWYLIRMKRAKTLTKFAVVFCIVGLIIASIMPPLFFQRVQSIITLSDRGGGRLDIWKVYSSVILRHPFLGVGLEGGRSFFVRYSDAVIRERVPHNIYILSWAELGIVGFILLLLIIGSLFKQIFLSFSKVVIGSSEWRIGLIIILNFISLLILGIAEPILYRKFLWFGFSLIVVYSRIIRDSTLLNNSRNDIES